MFRALLFLCFICLVSCASSGRNPANIFFEDDRISIPREQRPNIGSIHKSSSWNSIIGTGFHIDRCHIVTSYHLLKDISEKISKDDFVYFSHTEKSGLIKAHPVASGRPFLRDQSDMGLTDWVILKLNKCRDVKGLKVRHISFIDLQNKSMKLYGFPRDRNFDDLSVDPDCKIGHEQNPLYKGLPHDCAVKKGNSGGPLIAEIDGEEFVVGVQSFKRRGFEEPFSEYASSWANMAVSVKEIEVIINNIMSSKIKKKL